jgi:hypothetical protein
MSGSASDVRAGAREIKQVKDAGRSEPKRVREPEDAEMRRYRASSARAAGVEAGILAEWKQVRRYTAAPQWHRADRH